MKNGKKMRLVVDVNVWISCLISHTLRERVDRITASGTILFSEKLLEELRQTTARPIFSRYFLPQQAETLIQYLALKMELINVTVFVNICRDPNDNFLLALAKDGNADYLITGDKDLLILKQYGKTKIVTIAEYELVINAEQYSIQQRPR